MQKFYNNNGPYNDEYMIFDETTCQYVLTEKAIEYHCGINLRARLEEDKTINADGVINKICRTVSDEIYEFIHGYSFYNAKQDYLIAHNMQLRAVIQKAMEYQAEYFIANGNLFFSTDTNKAGKEINQMSQNILINSGICFSGV